MGRWVIYPNGRDHKVASARYFGTGTIARSCCGLEFSVAYSVLTDTPKNPCGNCTRMAAG